MICCAMLSGFLALLLCAARRLSPAAARDPLSWRPYATPRADPPSPAFSMRARLKSFSYAFAGLAFMMRTQHNAWAHAAATCAVVTAGIIFRIGSNDWRWIVAALLFVWVAETMNTAFEHVCNVASPQFNLSVQRAKDIAAGAVLISAVGAATIGAIVFAPHALATMQ